MDLITIIWYFSTFLLLILFFVVMVCSDNVCNRRQNKPEDIAITAPPTPAPSYREFAPPGYDTVMKKYKNRIYIVPTGTEPGIFAPMQPPPLSPISSSVASPELTRTIISTISEVVAVQEQRQRRRNSSDSSVMSVEMARRGDGQERRLGALVVADSVNVAVVERCRVEEDHVSVIVMAEDDGGKVLAVKKCDDDDSRSVTG